MALYDAAALTGLEPHLPDEVIQAVHAIASQNGELLRKMGIFPPEIAVSGEAAPEDRFLGLHRPRAQGQISARRVIPRELV